MVAISLRWRWLAMVLGQCFLLLGETHVPINEDAIWWRVQTWVSSFNKHGTLHCGVHRLILFVKSDIINNATSCMVMNFIMHNQDLGIWQIPLIKQTPMSLFFLLLLHSFPLPLQHQFWRTKTNIHTSSGQYHLTMLWTQQSFVSSRGSNGNGWGLLPRMCSAFQRYDQLMSVSLKLKIKKII